MKHSTRIILISFLFSCNQADTNNKISVPHTDTAIISQPAEIILTDSSIIKTVARKEIDTALFISVSEEILRAFKTKNYKRFASFIHPQTGVRFSPYAYIDTINHKVFSSDQFLQLLKQNKKINWNSSFESETKPEYFTVKEYFEKFVYDADFLNADMKSINKYHSQGTDLNNIAEVYPEHTVVEFFFPGFEKKYDGLDFRALRLTFKSVANRPYLTGIIHDQWTP